MDKFANKVTLNGEDLIDLTADTATEETVFAGVKFHKADGSVGTGTYAAPEEFIAIIDESNPENSTVVIE